MEWIREGAALWDDDKARIIGQAPAGVFDTRYGELRAGEAVPGEWWRVEADGQIVGYGWLDVVWGDAEILLATDAGARNRGVGSFIVEKLESEARAGGLNYLYNVVRPTHPQAEALTNWLQKRGFSALEDGRLLRAVVAAI